MDNANEAAKQAVQKALHSRMMAVALAQGKAPTACTGMGMGMGTVWHGMAGTAARLTWACLPGSCSSTRNVTLPARGLREPVRVLGD